MVEASIAEEVKVETGLTAKSIVIGLIGCVYTAIINYERYSEFLRSDVLDYWCQNFCGLGVIGNAMGLMILIAIINRIALSRNWNFRFTRQEAAVIFIFTMLGAYLMEGSYQQGFEEWFSEGMYVARQSPEKQAEYWACFPDTLAFGPKTPEPYAPLITPGLRTLSVDWIAFMPMIITGILWFSFMYLFYIFGSLLLRRLYTRVEYLPMPFTQVMTGVIDLTQPGSRKIKLFASKLFIVGFLISFLYHFSVQGIKPWYTLITGTPLELPWDIAGVSPYPVWDFTERAWLPWVPLYITLMPWEIGWAMMLPVNVLVTALIVGIGTFFIFPPIYMGTYWGPFEGSPNSAVRIVAYNWDWDDLGFSHPCILIGMLIAAVVAPIVIHWRQMAPIFKSLIREPPREFDPDRPLPYRITFLLTIVFFILWYLVGVTLIQAKPDALLGFMIIISVLFFGVGRVLSETGGWYGAFHLNPYMSYEGTTGGLAGTFFTTLDDDIPSYVTVYMFSERGHMYSSGDRVPFFSYHAYKLADNTRTRVKDMVKVLLVGAVIAVVAAAFLHFINRAWSPYIWKIRGEYIKKSVDYARRGRVHRNYSQWVETPVQSFIQIALGFAIIFILSFLQPRIGFLRGLSIGAVIWGFQALYLQWVPWLIGFIIKYLAIKTGGIRLYEEKIRPLALGLVVGAFIVLALMNLGNWLVWAIWGIK